MQYVAVASQKFTCPVVNDVVPAVTMAASVTTVQDVTVVTGLPAAVIASVTAVASPLRRPSCCCANVLLVDVTRIFAVFGAQWMKV